MTTATTRTDPRFAAALATERAMHAAAASRVVTAEWGTAYLRPDIGACYDENFLWAEGDAAGADAATLDAHAARLLGGAGMAHRRVLADGATGERLAPGFAALGYTIGGHLVMAHDGPPPPAPDVEVADVGMEEFLAAQDHYLRTDPDNAWAATDDAGRRAMLEHHRAYGSAGARERRLAVRVDGAIAAWAKLWECPGGVWQVEDVVCLAEHRGRGLGRAVAAAATRAALRRDPRLLFIVAETADWPKELYGRLGYTGVGEVGVFLHLTAGAAG